MYIEATERYYLGTEQRVGRARFLILLQLKSQPCCSPENTFAIVRTVALRQLGHSMMGRARIHGRGKWESVSGAYGNDGLPMTVEELPADAIPLPRDLYNMWSKGGGWNSAGSEAGPMAEWANRVFPRKPARR